MKPMEDRHILSDSVFCSCLKPQNFNNESTNKLIFRYVYHSIATCCGMDLFFGILA